MIYRLVNTLEFDKKFFKLDNSIRHRLIKIIGDLKKNPYSGKPLGYSFFREKKFEKYRVCFLIYSVQNIILLVNLSDKKDQKQTIEAIKNLFDVYRKKVEKLG